MIDSMASITVYFYSYCVVDDVVSHCTAFMGPSVYDRILAVNMFGTKTEILIGVLVT